MNIYRLIILAMAFSTTATYAAGSSIELYERFDDVRVVTAMATDDIENSPTWNPDSDPLPFSVDRAIQSIRDFIKQPNEFGSIEEIEIRTIKNHPGHWHYLFKVANKDTSGRGFNVYAVLMNGKVIPAFIEPGS